MSNLLPLPKKFHFKITHERESPKWLKQKNHLETTVFVFLHSLRLYGLHLRINLFPTKYKVFVRNGNIVLSKDGCKAIHQLSQKPSIIQPIKCRLDASMLDGNSTEKWKIPVLTMIYNICTAIWAMHSFQGGFNRRIMYSKGDEWRPSVNFSIG